MSSTPLIRPAGAADVPRLALIGAASFLETFAGVIDGDALMEHCRAQHSEEAYKSYLARGAHAWLAETAGAPIGYALLTEPELDAARDGDRELKRIYFLSRFHGIGAGTSLLDAAVAAAAGCKRLLLGVKDDNARAIAFYRKHGFVQIATRRFDVGGALYDDVVLARPMREMASQ